MQSCFPAGVASNANCKKARNLKFLTPKNPGGGLPRGRLMGMCPWIGSYFHDWIDYYGVAFLQE